LAQCASTLQRRPLHPTRGHDVKKTEATTQAVQQSKKPRKAAANNLTELNDSPESQANPSELNRKIGEIDAELDQLRSSLT
jgi:hypothetical protein